MSVPSLPPHLSLAPPGRWREVSSAAEPGRLPPPGRARAGVPPVGEPVRGRERRAGLGRRSGGAPPARLRQGGGLGWLVPGGRPGAAGAARGRARLASRPFHQVLALRERAQPWCRIPSGSPCVAKADLRRRTAAEGDPSA